VALAGDTVVIGAVGDDIGARLDQGSAHVFTREPGGLSWSEGQALVATSGDAFDYDHVGHSVALDGETIAVGAYGTNAGGLLDAGRIYTTARGPVPWPETSLIVANDGATSDNFGWSVALDADTAVIGAAFDDVGTNTDQGSAYVFVRNGPIWVLQQKLIAGDGAMLDYFGWSVALAGDTAVIGAFADDVGANVDQGSGYVFIRTGSIWTEQGRLNAGDGAAHDHFGRSVALDGDTALIGADQDDVGANGDQGSAYVFSRGGSARDGGMWIEEQKLTAGDGAAVDVFGCAVALDGDLALIGAYADDVQENANQGSAYVFVRNSNAAGGGLWSQQQKLTAGDGAEDDNFGLSVALDGEIALVGAAVAGVGGRQAQGAAYIFARSGTTWLWEQKLLAGNGAAGVGAAFDLFGDAVALSGDTALVGAPFADGAGYSDRGRAYFFERQPGMFGSYLPVMVK
jgi:hypothetical protein